MHRGIGLRSALLFAQEGAYVLFVYVNLPAAALKADMGKEADVKAAVDNTVELFGRLDVMVRVYLFLLLLACLLY